MDGLLGVSLHSHFHWEVGGYHTKPRLTTLWAGRKIFARIMKVGRN
jgi:hypothetical protein